MKTICGVFVGSDRCFVALVVQEEAEVAEPSPKLLQIVVELAVGLSTAHCRRRRGPRR
jgi:hypothetical protein